MFVISGVRNIESSLYIHFRSTVESRYLEHSISRTLDVSNKFVGPLTVRDIERWLYCVSFVVAKHRVLIFDLNINNGKLKSFNSVGIRLFHKKKIEKIYCE